MNKKITKFIAALALLLFMTPAMVGWGQTVSENDVLWTEPFGGNPSSSTTFSETTSWSDYINPTTFVSSDASLLLYTSSKAMANSGTATNMTGAHVWLNKSVDSYIQISGIKLYNATKVKISWAQATSGSSTTVYYQFDGTGEFTSLSTCSGPNANFESSELSVENHTTIALKFFHPSSNSKNTRIDNLTLKATEVSGGTPTCATPTFSPAAGTYYGTQRVTISCATSGATVYYTTNGSNPTTSSSVYSTPIEISQNTTVKAMGVKAGMDNSTVAEASYIIQPTVFNQDWEGQMNGWTFVSVTGDQVWNVSSYQSNHYAKMSGYSGGNYANEDWCISPAFNLEDYTNPVLTFTTARSQHNGNELEVYFSNNYDGTNVSSATWTQLTCTLPAQPSSGYTAFTSSGDIDLSSYTGTNCYIGFKYTSTTSAAVTWELDDIVLASQTSTPVITLTPSSINVGSNNPIGEPISTTFTVSQSNLTEGIALSATIGTLSLSSIAQGADDTEVTWTYTPTSVGSINASITATSSGAETQTITISGAAVAPITGDCYELVTEAPQDWSGCYIITGTNSGNYYALTGVTSNLGTAAAVEVVGNKIASNGTTNAYRVFVAQTSDNKYSLFMENVGYLAYTSEAESGNNNLYALDTYASNTCEWTFSVSNNLVTLTNVFNTSRMLQFNYNSGNPRFACYTSNQVKLTLFKYTGTVVLPPVINVTNNAISLDYDATSGSIAYTIDNPVSGQDLTATSTANWISGITVNSSSVTFTTTVNNSNTARTATITLAYQGAESVDVTVTQAAYVAPPTPGSWVLTSLDDLTSNDVFVIVGTIPTGSTDDVRTFALPYSNGSSSAPAVVAVTVENDMITSTVDAAIQWNISSDADGYTFYPNGDAESWLYCTANNDGVRVGTNVNNAFTFVNTADEDHPNQDYYLYNTATGRYLGIYITSNGSGHAQDWRCYTAAYNNIKNQSFAFYKKVVATETIPLDIAAWTTDQNGVPGNWYLITSPLADPIIPTAVGNMIPENLSNVDLYRFDQTANLEWINYKKEENGNVVVNNAFGNLIAGQGYLYANASDVQLQFTGTPYSGDGVIQLRYYTNNQDSNMHGVNLIGNPFNVETTIGDQDFYRMNPEGRKEIVLAYDENNTNPSIAPMEGIFVHATGTDQSVTFTPLNSKATRVVERTWIELCQNDLVIDRASIRYGEGTPLPKIQLNENNTKIYFPMEDGNYSVIIGNYQDEVPLNFMAATAGTYTLNFTNQNAEFNTLILVDNQTNTQVNLLNNPSYSFSAQTTDDEARFIVVYQRASSYLTIGTGDLYSASGNNSSDSTKDGMGSPVGNTYYTASTAQFIYMASEMEGAKTIRSLAFYHNNQGPFVGTVKIYLAHTSASQVYTSNPATSGTLVYEGTNINIGSSSAGWQTFTLDTPFPYNGTDNLLVVVCRTKATSGNPNYDADQGWKYTSYSQHYYYMQRSGNSNDTYGNIATTGNYARGFKRPNIKIGYTAPVINHFDLDIDGWTSNGNYYLIASPIGQVAPTAVDNMLSNSYDLYYFDQDGDEEGYEWITYKPGNGATDPEFDLVPGKGYLYANSGVAGNNPNVVTLTFTGWGYTGSGQVDLTYSEANSDPNMWGWNLVGNPFGVEAYIDRPFYRMNGEGSEINGESETGSIGVMEGVFVHATQSETMTFTTTPPTKDSKGLALDLSNGRNVIDRAIVRFDEGQQLPKLQLNKNNTKLYISQDNKDYAIVCAEEQGEMPVSFKAEDNGTYTLSFSSENVEFAYLHLVDNMTGADVDLLQTPSYSFEAKSTDYASRFKLVFATGDDANANFAFFSNGSFVINNEGNATLQVIDVTGRILKSESINGCASVDVNAAPGVYILRLVNGDNVKVQKVVIR